MLAPSFCYNLRFKDIQYIFLVKTGKIRKSAFFQMEKDYSVQIIKERYFKKGFDKCFILPSIN